MSSQKIETGHKDLVHDVAMDYYGRRLATASSDGTVEIISVSSDSQKLLATLTGHKGPVWQVAWANPNFGTLLASCSYDGRVIIWKETTLHEWTQSHVFTDHKVSVNSISWAPTEVGLCLACASSDGNISVYSFRSNGGWDRTSINEAHPVGVTSISWAPSTTPGDIAGSELGHQSVMKLVSGGCDNTIKIWKFDHGSWIMDISSPLIMHTGWVSDVAWAPNLRLRKSTIASASQDGTVIIWTADEKEDKWEGRVLKDFKKPVWRVSWSTIGNLLAVTAEGVDSVSLWKEAVDGKWEEFKAIES